MLKNANDLTWAAGLEEENKIDSFKCESSDLNESNLEETTKEKEEDIEIITSWDELDLNPFILRGIYSKGFEKPSPIQQKAIKPIMDGRDIIAQAQSGTGKTATFTIGALSRIDLTSKQIQVLVLSPTRELCKQTYDVVTAIGSMMKGLQVQMLVGGTPMEEDISNLKNNTPHVITGCPGRIFDMMRRNNINCKHIKLIVVDEADELLSFGFKQQLYDIFQYLPQNIQVALFSATLPSGLNSITDKIMRNPINIIVKAEQLTLEGIKQYFIAIENDHQKYDTLKDLFSQISVSQCIIYCNSVMRVQDLYDAMLKDGFPVGCIHSNLDKFQRDSAFEEFKSGKTRVLISSNVTSRGIDIQQVSTVINFDLPKDNHNYLHRIGRSGRWGRKGVGINFVNRRDISKMKEIESYYACQIDEFTTNALL
jgi:ATP-dependent RNA helicase